MTLRLLSLACAVALWGGAPHAALAQADASAQVANDQAFDIPAGPLADALTEFGLQSGLQISYSQDTVRDLRSNAVKGRHRPAQALQLLLRNTGMEFSFINASTVLVRPAAKPRDPAPRRPRSSTTDGEANEQDIVGLPAIMVQGTRTLNMDIMRTEDDPQPYVVFDREKIQQSSAQNLEGFLRDRLPMNANGAPIGLRITSGGVQSGFNLRGLGRGQTLILINGRRTTPGPSAGTSTPLQANINGIPMSAVERIEVLPATASGIYGGSATGGVINIILRQDYAGTEIKATYGNAFDSDVAERRLDLSMGFNPGERTNVLVTASYSDHNSLHLRDRPELVERYYDIVSANAPDALLPPNNPPLGARPNIRSVDGSDLVLKDGTPLSSPITYVPAGYAGTWTDGGGALVPNAGQYDPGLANTTQHITGGGTQLGQAPRNAALRATLRHEFSPRVQAFLEANASETVTNGLAPVLFGSSTQPVRVSAAASNNPFTSDILVTAPMHFPGDRSVVNETQHRVTGGLVVALPHDWKAAADYTWGETRVKLDGVRFSPNPAVVAGIMDGTLDVLRDTVAYPIDLTQDMVAGNLSLDQKIAFEDVALRFAGPILELPAGQVVLSTLLEYREERFAESVQTTPGLSLIFPSRSAAATSLYVETKVPLFSEKNRRPGFEALDLQLAARVDEYRTNGKTGFVIEGTNTPVVSASNTTRSANPTVALRWQPFESLVLRTSYGTGFVAPNVSQLAPSVYTVPVVVVDPRRGGTMTTLDVGQVLHQGNPDLEPEESRSWSAGFILTPSSIPDLRLSLDYTRIRKTNNIAAYPTSFQGIVNDETLLPGRVTRGPNLPGDPTGWAGPITLLDGSLFNIASSDVEAFDLQLDYSRATQIGTFSLATVATWQTHYRTTALVGQPELENVGMGYANPQKFTGNMELRWRRNAWTAGWLARYYDAYQTSIPGLPTNAANIALQGNGGRVPSQIYHDLYVNWVADLSPRPVPGFLQGTEIQLGVRNVFDKLPPFDAAYYNVFRAFHSPLGDPLGTTYQLAITKRF